MKGKVIAGAAAALAVAGGGAAVAATQLGSPNQENQAVIDDAAKRLGVQPGALENALKQALEARVDAAVAAGRLSEAQGNELKARIEAGGFPLLGVFPLLGGPLLRHPAILRGLDVAASYLGLSEANLRAKLEGGQTLAGIAKTGGKSVDGLVRALVADAKKHLDAAVAAGRLTRSEESSILPRIEEHIKALVNGTLPPPPFDGPRFRGGPGFLPPGAPPFFRRPAAHEWFRPAA
jgi:hypothetical protein